MHKPLLDLEVRVEANRCLYCYDAPCIRACPTHIDIPAFIAQIADGNLKGSARTILEANPMGASCARVCPTEELCEGACVYAEDETPIRIGDLQRYATDWVRASGAVLFQAGAPTGKSVAVIGGGPAGLSAARDLRRFGHAVTIFEAKEQLGGLNTYGIVPFRLDLDVALWEADEVRKLGCDVRTGVRVGVDVEAQSLLDEFGATILACGMGGVPRLDIPGGEYVVDALDLIERAKTGTMTTTVGPRVAVIGAGNTAIDALTCCKRLGAERVTMFYWRGEEQMTAYAFEYDFAKREGVEFRFSCAPVRVLVEGDRVAGAEFVRTRSKTRNEPPLPVAGSEFIEQVDTIVAAIGQGRLESTFDALGVAHKRGVVLVDAKLGTSRRGVFAAGDCIFEKGSREAMVVEAAEQGKIAAQSVNAFLGGSA